MTKAELFFKITEQLQKAGCDSPAFDACCLLEDLAGLPHAMDPRACCEEVSREEETAVLAAAARRAAGEPLQYILGEWDFLSLTLCVGRGVLIPRPDTELLCETAAQKMKGTDSPKILDLCAGSGCVGLGIASFVPNAVVTAVEYSDDALVYLRRNIARYAAYHVTAVQDNILSPAGEYAEYDLIVSNPPYIPTVDLAGLMREVQHEPRMALDGDADGLRFYRCLTADWTAHLRDGGFMAVEVGIGQAAAVKALMEHVGLENIEVYTDLGGIDRVVCGRKRKS